ncbi:MAG: HAMP domain-containing histidine kinase [Kangiellaceae bacterium]|nr:HAMP domain-containing histidine kinase [Kangiellaceae bacterium]
MMSIRNKFLLLFALLLAALLAVQTWLFYQYTDQVAEKFGEAAFSISKDTASIFVYNQDNFQQKQTFSYRENGQTFTKTIIIPKSRDLQMLLHDDTKDDQIKVVGGELEFTIPIPRTPLETTLAQLKSKMIWLTFGLFAVVILIAGFIIYSMLRPLSALNKTAQKISQGELGAKIDLTENQYPSDFKQTVTQFNRMSDALVDLDKQKQQQQELEHFRELSDISRGLAHNLRNPLNTLLLSIEQLSEAGSKPDTNNPSAAKKLKQLATQQVQRIDDWLKNFMLLMEQGLEPEPVCIQELIDEAISQLQLSDIDAKVTFKAADTLAKSDLIHCVKTELTMVLQMVLHNAYEASLEATELLPIVLTTHVDNDVLTVTIEDQGLGINPELKDKLFNPYVTDKTYGTGMGLYIAKRIVKHRYNGSIELVANQPQGTKAIIKISTRRTA